MKPGNTHLILSSGSQHCAHWAVQRGLGDADSWKCAADVAKPGPSRSYSHSVTQPSRLDLDLRQAHMVTSWFGSRQSLPGHHVGLCDETNSLAGVVSLIVLAPAALMDLAMRRDLRSASLTSHLTRAAVHVFFLYIHQHRPLLCSLLNPWVHICLNLGVLLSRFWKRNSRGSIDSLMDDGRLMAFISSMSVGIMPVCHSRWHLARHR